MSQFNTTLENGRLLVSLQGNLTREVALQVKDGVLAELTDAAADVCVQFDFCGLSESSVFARSVLVELQQQIRDQGRRTAYVADVARFRGFALWVINLAEDGNAKSCLSQKVADAWLSSSDSRLDEIRHLARVKGGAR